MFKKACMQCESPNLELITIHTQRSRVPIVDGVPQYENAIKDKPTPSENIIVCRDCGRGHEYELDETGRIVRMTLE